MPCCTGSAQVQMYYSAACSKHFLGVCLTPPVPVRTYDRLQVCPGRRRPDIAYLLQNTGLQATLGSLAAMCSTLSALVARQTLRPASGRHPGLSSPRRTTALYLDGRQTIVATCACGTHSQLQILILQHSTKGLLLVCSSFADSCRRKSELILTFGRLLRVCER